MDNTSLYLSENAFEERFSEGSIEKLFKKNASGMNQNIENVRIIINTYLNQA